MNNSQGEKGGNSMSGHAGLKITTSGVRVFIVIALTVVGGLGQGVRAGVIAHNGQVTSNPVGNGDVDVEFFELTGGGVPVDGADQHFAIYGSVVAHTLLDIYDEGQTLNLVVDSPVNQTGVSWSNYVVQLEGADFLDIGGNLVDAVDSIGLFGSINKILLIEGGDSVSIAEAGIIRTDEGATLIISFDDPIDHNEGISLAFIVGDIGVTDLGYTSVRTPIASIIPEPISAAMLGMIGVVCLYGRRSRKSS